MFSPMMIQYLVGLCCLRHDPDAVEITLGDMVYDSAAGKSRDVDVTITVEDGDGNIQAFKAVEVKAEGKPLDITTIEQLSLKLTDMPKVTQKAIFSTSGYTDGAVAKAKAHSVDLYTFIPWETPIGNDFNDFEGTGKPSEFLAHIESNLLYWENYKTYVVVPEGPEQFTYNNDTKVLTVSGKGHPDFSDMNIYINNIIRRSTGILCMQEPATKMLIINLNESVPCGEEFPIGQAWSHSHTLDVRSDCAHLKFETGIKQIEQITISGRMQWKKKKLRPEFYILKSVQNGAIFAGAAIAQYGTDDESMFAMIFPEEGRTLGIHRVDIPEKQRNIIRNLKIK